MQTVDSHWRIVESGVSPTTTWHDEGDTAAFAARLAALPGVRDCHITLHGDLGAGKTTLVRHLLGALGVTGRIKSPTYAVVEPHEAQGVAGGPALAIWHFDFYRFNDPQEWEDAGFRELFASPGLKLVEWPDKAGAKLPPPDLAIHLDTQPNQVRAVRLQAHTAVGMQLIEGLA